MPLSGGSPRSDESDDSVDDSNKVELALILAKESQIQPAPIVCLIACSLALLLLALAHGGHGAPSMLGLECGSFGYWAMMLANVPVSAFACVFATRHAMTRYRTKIILGFPSQPGDLHWTMPTVVKAVSGFALAGLFAGSLGIGGAIVQGPLMHELGMLPEVIQATSSFNVVFTTFTVTSQFLILGMEQVDYALGFGAVGFLAGLIGNTVIHRLVKRLQSGAMLTLALACSIVLSALAMGISGGVSLSRSVHDHLPLGFGSLC
mmetsp:Transcript_28783/g.62160  ORF Transcript_28783/g.62160 Transcript_28783/m.62160 type:complete len:263 (-) Transcript_28783:48-836(-)